MWTDVDFCDSEIACRVIVYTYIYMYYLYNVCVLYDHILQINIYIYIYNIHIILYIYIFISYALEILDMAAFRVNYFHGHVTHSKEAWLTSMPH